MNKAEVPISIAMMGEPEHVLDRYRELVASGTAPRLAEILSTRHFPGALGDTMRLAELPPLEQTHPAYARRVRAAAEAAGIKLSANSRYNPTMADSRRGGDPNAWIHAGDGPSTYKARLREMGGSSEDLGVEGDRSRQIEDFEKKKEAHRKRVALKREQAMDRMAALKKKVLQQGEAKTLREMNK